MAARTKKQQPYKLTGAIWEELLSRLCAGESLRQICKADKMPTRQWIHKALLRDEERYVQYCTAKAIGVDEMVDETLEIADDKSDDIITLADGRQIADKEHIARSRLKVDTRKWYASKIAPKIYGNHSIHSLQGPDGEALVLTDEDRAVKLALLMERAKDRRESASE